MSRLRILFRRKFLVPNYTSFHSYHSRNRPLNLPLSSQVTLTTGRPEGIMIGRFIRKISTVALPSSSPEPVLEDTTSLENYENAIKALNTLQSNAATIAKIRENREIRRSSSLPQTIAALIESGLSMEALDNLDVIHVAGTKGKGMTCAFTESILRQAGLKTGFYSSPHLTAVRERIRINGQPISEEKFASTFFTIYNKLKHLKEEYVEGEHHACEMPNYFRFLTIMAFHVFIEERVDAVVLEVGIGGKFDCTNIIRNPVAVGITSLGLEHQHILGASLEDITSHKAGIMKEGTPAYTVTTHPPNIQELLREHAKQVGCSLEVVEPLDFSGIQLGVDDGTVSPLNAALAINLANELLIKKHGHIFPKNTTQDGDNDLYAYSKDTTMFLPYLLRGLQLTEWPGRFQRIQDSTNKRINYFLDGAHTIDSLKCTLKWFNNCSSSARSLRLLVFNLTGQRDIHTLMLPLVKSEIFDLAMFCPIIASSSGSASDNWSSLRSEANDPLEGCRELARVWEDVQARAKGVVLANAEETLDYIRDLSQGEKYRVNVLITGSLHLVGTFLSVLQPNLNDSNE